MKPLATSASSPFAAGRTPNFKSAKHVQEADKHPPETGGIHAFRVASLPLRKIAIQA